jgi:hypothetical protein
LGRALPSPLTGAVDQTFRLVVRPDLWGRTIRLRFSNAVGTRPLTLDGVHVGLQARGGALARGTNQSVRFARQSSVVIPPRTAIYSDPVTLPFVTSADDPLLAGRRLAVSGHACGGRTGARARPPAARRHAPRRPPAPAAGRARRRGRRSARR